MSTDDRLLNERFPRSNAYHPDWILAGMSGGAHVLWLTEWLTSAMDLRPGMRVLDLGCGRALSSIFLRREFGVEVWAADLWFSASENLRRVEDAGVKDGVFPLHAEARSLPFAPDFFDAVISLDSFPYYGTDDLYLNYIGRFLKPGGVLGIAGAGLIGDWTGPVPKALRGWWEPSMCCLHTAAWWRHHWERTTLAEVLLSDSMPDGWKLWLQWQNAVAPDNLSEIQALETDRGEYLGYVRTVARIRPEAKLEEPITGVPEQYSARPLLRRI